MLKYKPLNTHYSRAGIKNIWIFKSCKTIFKMYFIDSFFFQKMWGKFSENNYWKNVKISQKCFLAESLLFSSLINNDHWIWCKICINPKRKEKFQIYFEKGSWKYFTSRLHEFKHPTRLATRPHRFLVELTRCNRLFSSRLWKSGFLTSLTPKNF